MLRRVAAELPVTEGAERLISTLKRLGYRVGILSGGFTYFARELQRRLGLDCVYANELEIEDGRLPPGAIVPGRFSEANAKSPLPAWVSAVTSSSRTTATSERRKSCARAMGGSASPSSMVTTLSTRPVVSGSMGIGCPALTRSVADLVLVHVDAAGS